MPPRLKAAQRILGAILALSSLVAAPPLLIALALGEPTAQAFLDSLLITGGAGLAIWWPVREARYELRLRDGFLATTAIWALAALVAAIPFALAIPGLSYTDAVFEAASGLTTTGATMIVGLDGLPRSLLFYRQSLNFLGGMGIVVLAVAVLPTLKVGGMQLFRAESTGPGRDGRMTPRIADTAKALWLVYAGLTALCALAYWFGGMSLFDAVCHALSTLATGGFSTHDASFGYWDSPLLEGIAIVFMLLGGMSFGLHWYAWRRATVAHYQADSELRAYLALFAAVAVAVSVSNYLGGAFADFPTSVRHSVFQSASTVSSTGFTTTGFAQWPGMAPLLLLLVAAVGGCAGSTAGGMKVARVLMLLRTALREVKQLVHPKGQFLVTVGGKRVSESIVIAVGGFCSLYALSIAGITLALAATGMAAGTAFSAAMACINNLGPGIGPGAADFRAASDAATWICAFTMVLGRLEVFTVLVLLSPQFWQE